jgi:hypothetical protein
MMHQSFWVCLHLLQQSQYHPLLSLALKTYLFSWLIGMEFLSPLAAQASFSRTIV